MVTHDLPYARERCPGTLIPSGGAIADDGPTGELRSGEAPLRGRRLDRPFGSDPRAATTRRQEM